MTEEQERAAFESFWTCNLLGFAAVGSREFTLGWISWQARAALSQIEASTPDPLPQEIDEAIRLSEKEMR